jgi:hypothetical protein
MYSRQEASRIKTAFWTSFGQYMKPIPSAWKDKVNWLNYKTGIKDIFFRMHADNKQASIGIELTHHDAIIRHYAFEKMQLLKSMLEEASGEEWDWQLERFDEHGRAISVISISLPHVSIMRQEDWPALISFFKPRIIALDAFWSDAKDIIEMQLQ